MFTERSKDLNHTKHLIDPLNIVLKEYFSIPKHGSVLFCNEICIELDSSNVYQRKFVKFFKMSVSENNYVVVNESRSYGAGIHILTKAIHSVQIFNRHVPIPEYAKCVQLQTSNSVINLAAGFFSLSSLGNSSSSFRLLPNTVIFPFKDEKMKDLISDKIFYTDKIFNSADEGIGSIRIAYFDDIFMHKQINSSFVEIEPFLSRRNETVIFDWKPELKYDINSVSLFTQFTVERLRRFITIVGRWTPYPTVAVVYLTYPHDVFTLFYYMNKYPILKNSILKIVKPSFEKVESFYPINWLRNLAFSATPTDYVLYIEADFIPSVNLGSYASNVVVPLIISFPFPVAFVVSAWNLKQNFKGKIPKDKHDLLELYNYNFVSTPYFNGHGTSGYEIMLFSNSYTQVEHPIQLNHNIEYDETIKPTSPWYPGTSSTEYFEVCFENQWEPYYIVRKRTDVMLWAKRKIKTVNLPSYDERFTNQGGDKQQHALHLNAIGYRFFVLKHHFIIHLNHGGQLMSSWPGGFLNDTKPFNFFDDYIPEMELIFGKFARWPKCLYPLDSIFNGRSIYGATGGF